MFSIFSLALAFTGAAYATPTLSISGSCPGDTTIEVTGASPNSWVGIFTGTEGDSHTFGGGPCGGSTLDIGTALFAAKSRTDADGNTSRTKYLGDLGCGHAIQLLDLGDCSVSDVAFNPEPADIYNPYTAYEGWQTLDYEGYGYLYHMKWDISGTPVEWMDAACANCEFMFDVTGVADKKESWGKNSFGGIYYDARYGYSSNFLAAGESWVRSYYGAYYWWGYASLAVDAADEDAMKFNYWYGYVDYYYAGAYYTYWHYGDVTVQ